MAMNPEVKALWLAALRGGEYEQTTNNLTKVFLRLKQGREQATYGSVVSTVMADYEPTGKEAHCCLGVASDLAVKAGLDLAVKDGDGMARPEYDYDNDENRVYWMCRDYNGVGGIMPGAVVLWAGLAPHVKNAKVGEDSYNVYDDEGAAVYELGIDPATIEPSGEYVIGYTRPDGSLSSLDVANDDGRTFAEIADIIEAQF